MRTSQQAYEDSGEVVKRHQKAKNMFLCALLFVAFLGLLLLIIFTTVTRNLETCNTTTCLAFLLKLRNSHNITIDPCDDFYSYTCGNWEANYTRGLNMPLVNVFDVLSEENQLIMRRLLEEPHLGFHSSAKEKAVQFYTSCMNTEQIEARGAQPLEELIDKGLPLYKYRLQDLWERISQLARLQSAMHFDGAVIGGWNITGTWKETDFNQTLQILMGKYNTFPFFKAYVGPNASDPSTNIIQIDHPEFELPPETQFKKTGTYSQVLRLYFQYLTKLGHLMGGRADLTTTYIALAFSFISNLQKAVTPLKVRKEKRMLFYSTSIKELQEKAPAIDWLLCLQAAFYPVQLNMSQPIAVHDMEYLKGMSQLIGEWQQKRDVLQIYMILYLVRNLSPALDRQFEEAHQELTDKLNSRATNPEMVKAERWRKCLRETSMFFGSVLGKMVVQEIFPQKAKDLAEQMFSEIRDAIYSHLDRVEWMGSQSRQEAKDKIYSLQVEIGYPESTLQTDEVDNEYQELEIYEDNFFHNVVACLKALRKRFSLRLINPHLQDNWEVPPWSVHSYYSLRRHAVVFPAGMFRNPFFHTEFPSAVNFGAMGFFMAHELLHSFYDYVLPENCLACDMKTLAQRIDCLVKQYESYSLKGHSINGSFTLLENAADTGGLAMAYQAYKNWLEKHRDLKKLPWPEVSHDQLFFISFAHAMCGQQSPKGLQTSLHKDLHSPPPLRVLGSLSNSEDFSRHFHCPSKSPVNPAVKCHIW